MITPAFEIVQNDKFIILSIRAPFANISETEINVDGCELIFTSTPYFLRLNFSGPLIQNGREKADYNSDLGSITISMPKANEGEHFEDLDLLTKLLAPPSNCRSAAKKPLIEVVGSDDDGKVPDDDDTFDWLVDQQPYVEAEPSLDAPKYGFANQRSGTIGRLQFELSSIIDLQDADTTPVSKRRELRLAAEAEKFDWEHYLADLYETDVVDKLLVYRPPWHDELEQVQQGHIIEFTCEEKERLRKLPRKEYLLDGAESRSVFMGLVDILYAFAYNHRTTEGENTVESGWTVSKLSSTLSWFETYESLSDILVASYRRSLCFPLFRSWRLAEQIFTDVKTILTSGRRRVLKCLLEVYDMFIHEGDGRFILNDLYITDYCIWIQHIKDKKLSSLSDVLEKIVIKKDDVGLGLVDLELAGATAIQSTEDDSDCDSESTESTSDTETSSDNNSSDEDNDQCIKSESTIVTSFMKTDNDRLTLLNDQSNNDLISVTDQFSDCAITSSTSRLVEEQDL